MIFRISLILLVSLGVCAPQTAHSVCDTSAFLRSFGGNFENAIKQKFLDHFQKKYPAFEFSHVKVSDRLELQYFINEMREEFVPNYRNLQTALDQDIIDLQTAYLNSKSALFVIKSKEGKIVGCGGFAKTGLNEVELRKIYFDPSMRGNGVGREWVTSLVDLARELGNENIWLTTIPKMEKAVKIYRDLGFRDFVPVVNKSYGLENVIFLKKPLKEGTIRK